MISVTASHAYSAGVPAAAATKASTVISVFKSAAVVSASPIVNTPPPGRSIVSPEAYDPAVVIAASIAVFNAAASAYVLAENVHVISPPVTLPNAAD